MGVFVWAESGQAQFTLVSFDENGTNGYTPAVLKQFNAVQQKKTVKTVQNTHTNIQI